MRVPVRMARPSLVSGESVSPGKEVAVLAGETMCASELACRSRWSGSYQKRALGIIKSESDSRQRCWSYM
jgi:hypothetical protein